MSTFIQLLFEDVNGTIQIDHLPWGGGREGVVWRLFENISLHAMKYFQMRWAIKLSPADLNPRIALIFMMQIYLHKISYIIFFASSNANWQGRTQSEASSLSPMLLLVRSVTVVVGNRQCLLGIPPPNSTFIWMAMGIKRHFLVLYKWHRPCHVTIAVVINCN